MRQMEQLDEDLSTIVEAIETKCGVELDKITDRIYLGPLSVLAHDRSIVIRNVSRTITDDEVFELLEKTLELKKYRFTSRYFRAFEPGAQTASQWTIPYFGRFKTIQQ